jgi:hypothetical protein
MGNNGHDTDRVIGGIWHQPIGEEGEHSMVCNKVDPDDPYLSWNGAQIAELSTQAV